MKRRSKYSNNHGYTLIEIVMVIVILGVIGAFTFSFVADGVRAFQKSRDRKELYDQGRLALERMSREIRDAYEVTECSPGSSFSFKVAHPSTYGVTETEEIKYELVDMDLKRIGNPSGTQKTAVLASNVDKFEVGLGEALIDASSSTGTATATANSLTISHTTTGTHRLMLVGVSLHNENYETVTGVTYNGTALTPVGTRAEDDDARIYIYSLVAPSIGTHDVVITFSTGLTREAMAGVITFTGVDQDTPLGTFASADQDDGATASVDIPSADGELVFGVACSAWEALTASSGQDEIWNISLNGTNTNGAGGTVAGATPTVTMSWDLASADDWAIGGVSIKKTTSTPDVIVCDDVVGGGGTTLFSDDFGDGTFAGTWSKVSGVDMQETGGVFTTTDNAASHYKVDSGSAWTDYTYSVDAVANDDDTMGITFRVEDSNSFYLLEQEFGENGNWDLDLRLNDNGSWSTLGSMDNYGSSAGQVDDETTPHNFKVEVSGTNIKAYVDDVLKFDVNDSTVSGGTVGLWVSWNNGAEFDNALVEEGSGGGVPLLTLKLKLKDPQDEENFIIMRTKVYLRNMQ